MNKKVPSGSKFGRGDDRPQNRHDPRPEGEIFAELATLCRSPGFIYAIARMCLIDIMIGYIDEATQRTCSSSTNHQGLRAMK